MLLLPSFLLIPFVERLTVYISSLPVAPYQPIPSSSIIEAFKKTKTIKSQNFRKGNKSQISVRKIPWRFVWRKAGLAAADQN